MENLIEYTYPESNFETSFIYYLYLYDNLVYIGQTDKLGSRIDVHKESKLFDKILYKKVSSTYVEEIEKEEILKYCPVYNVGYLNKKSPNKIQKFDGFYIIRKYGIFPTKSVSYDHNRDTLTFIKDVGKLRMKISYNKKNDTLSNPSYFTLIGKDYKKIAFKK